MKRRIFLSICAVSVGSLLLLAACVVALVYRHTTQNTWADLAARAYYLSSAIEGEDTAYLSKVRGYTGRITLVAADGTVLFDDRQDPAGMENHADRPEVQQAFANGTGRVQRVSDTLGERTLYYAVRLPSGNVLRVSQTVSGVLGEAAQVVPFLLIVIALLVPLAALVAGRQARAILAPINEINLDEPLSSEAYGELSPLLRRIAAQKEQIDDGTRQLDRQRDELGIITRNMDEGLVVVNREGKVLELNGSACHILGAEDGDWYGQHILALNRNISLEQVIRAALGGEKINEVVELEGRKYQLRARPSVAEGEVQGVLLLFSDETEKLRAEQTRREFTANVSHELKTPLTSISGYAEIIHNGLAKPEDVRGFAGSIREEATRLIALVDDIIKLSRLDEKSDTLQKTEVDVWEVARQVARSLEDNAAAKGLELRLSGGSAKMLGTESVLDEVLYNLVDNAIRYSERGAITVRVEDAPDAVRVEVEDEGIGIPPAHQGRVFERFYRVDKSHSKESGGTGLGLAIVKRGVLFHGGEVSLQSSPGRGSRFFITLPKGLD